MKRLLLSALLALASPLPAALAATAGSVQTTSPSQSQLINTYSSWAGSPENAKALTTALRNGGTATLSDGTQSSTVTSNKSTGWGNVSLALAAASYSLQQYGITNPSPAQISAALNGGTLLTASGTVTLQGIQSMRESGMGWGTIAQALGTTVGQLKGHGRQNQQAAAAQRSQNKSGKQAGNDAAAKGADHGKGSGQGTGQGNGNAGAGGGGNAGGGGKGGGGGNGGGKGGGGR